MVSVIPCDIQAAKSAPFFRDEKLSTGAESLRGAPPPPPHRVQGSRPILSAYSHPTDVSLSKAQTEAWWHIELSITF